MDELTNEELVLYAAGGCDRARNLMMEKNEGLVASKAKIYWKGIYSSGMGVLLTHILTAVREKPRGNGS